MNMPAEMQFAREISFLNKTLKKKALNKKNREQINGLKRLMF